MRGLSIRDEFSGAETMPFWDPELITIYDADRPKTQKTRMIKKCQKKNSVR